MDVQRRASTAIQAPNGRGEFGASFLARHYACVQLADRKLLDEPPWGDDLPGYAAELVKRWGGDPARHLGRYQPRGISADERGARIRERVAAELTLLGATRRELLPVLGVTHPTSVTKLVNKHAERHELRRYFLEPELAERLVEIRDPEERETLRRYWIAQGRVVDSTLADEIARINRACDGPRRDDRTRGR